MAQRTLIILAIVITVLAFIAAEADFWSGHEEHGYHHYRSTGLYSFGVSHRGEIELDEAQSGIVRLSPDAHLDVRERRFTSRRRLEVRADAAGRPTYRFKVGARERSAEEAEAYLASVLDEIVRTTTVGAHARARRLLADEGLDGLLREVSRLDSNAARRIYLEIAAGLDGLEAAQAAEIVQTAGREMTSSARLRLLLTDLCERFPREWDLNRALLEAAEAIPSSTHKGHALVEIARLRGIGAGEEAAFADVASTIASTYERARTVTRIHELEPLPEIIEALLSTADTLESSGERRRVLMALVGEPGLPERVYSKALSVGAAIPSSSDKASFLAAVSAELPASDGLQREYVDVSGTISSSTEAKRALVALISSTALSEDICGHWIDTASGVASSSVRADLLVEGAAACPAGGQVWKSYLGAVERVPSSSDQRRALLALLDRDDLDEATLDQLAALAERGIASTSERRTVLDRVEQARTALNS